jgi:hypothetical protein
MKGRKIRNYLPQESKYLYSAILIILWGWWGGSRCLSAAPLRAAYVKNMIRHNGK